MWIKATGSRVICEQVPHAVARELMTTLTLPNPAHVGALKAGKSGYGIDPVLRYYRRRAETLVLPAACEPMARAAAERIGYGWSTVYTARELPELELELQGRLRLYQLAAVAEATRAEHAILDAPTGSGKTVCGCAAIAERQQPALVVVHTTILQRQWLQALEQWLGLKNEQLGRLGGGGEQRIGTVATVAIVRSLDKWLDELVPQVGHLIVDECHRAAAPQYWQALEQFDARYRLGLSATPYRRDGLGEAIQWALGPVVEVDRAPLIASGSVLPAEVEQQPTGFRTDIDASEHYQAAIAELVTDKQRNRQIARAVAAEKKLGAPVLVLSDRVEHCNAIAAELAIYFVPSDIAILHGKLKAAERRDAEAAIQLGAPIICATVQLVGEGFDLPAAAALILATPIKWSGRLLQAIGRVLRPSNGKTKGRIIDLADWQVPVLAAGARARAKVYKQLADAEQARPGAQESII